jgi:hypothetical protein
VGLSLLSPPRGFEKLVKMEEENLHTKSDDVRISGRPTLAKTARIGHPWC